MPTETKLPPVKVITTVDVDWDKITNAIIGAFEGGSTDWLRQAEYMPNDKPVRRGDPAYAEADFWVNDGQMKLSYDNPEKGPALARKVIGQTEIAHGLKAMASKHPRHFNDLVTENDDGITHDVFIQCVIFGKVIYG